MNAIVTRLILMSMGIKLLVDTSVQVFNPYLATIANGLGVSLVTLGQLVALRSAAGLVVPVIGAQADRFGHRPVIRICLLLSSVGLLLIGVGQGVALTAVAMALMGVGFAGFLPTLHAYLSSHLPYHRRGRGLGIVEYAWALAGIVGLWPLGHLIAWAGWRSAFVVLAVGVAVASFLVGRFPTTEEDAKTTRQQPSERFNLRRFLDLGSARRSAWGAIATGGFIFFAGTNVQLIYGSWLERSYGLGAGELGTTALLVGVALLAGSVSASLVSDRLGKRNSVLIGVAAMMVANLLLPVFDVGRVAAVAGVMLSLAVLEFAIVSHIPMMSEQVPEQRGKALSLATGISLIGRSLGSVTGPWALTTFGIGVVGPMAAAISGGALFTLLRFVRDAEAA